MVDPSPGSGDRPGPEVGNQDNAGLLVDDACLFGVGLLGLILQRRPICVGLLASASQHQPIGVGFLALSSWPWPLGAVLLALVFRRWSPSAGILASGCLALDFLRQPLGIDRRRPLDVNLLTLDFWCWSLGSNLLELPSQHCPFGVSL